MLLIITNQEYNLNKYEGELAEKVKVYKLNCCILLLFTVSTGIAVHNQCYGSGRFFPDSDPNIVNFVSYFYKKTLTIYSIFTILF
jgi:hypothetical protein